MSDATRSVLTPVESIAEILRRLRELELRPRPGSTAYPGFFEGPSLYLTASGNFVKATYPGLRAISVEMVGGGGGAGGAQATSSTQAAIGGSGGGGAYARALVLASDLDASEAYTVGPGGTAGGSTFDGGDGGDSVFDTISDEVRAAGGLGGAFSAPQTFPSAGASGGSGGATASSKGDLRIAGGDGGSGIAYSLNRLLLGHSGSSMFGAARASAATNGSGTGQQGYQYGGGARGGRNIPNQATSQPGAAGGQGLIIVHLLF
jgi:hypothetical protein